MTKHPRPASLARRALPALAVLGASGALLTRLGGSTDVGAALLSTTGATGSPTAGRAAAATPITPITPGAAPTTTLPRAVTPAPSAGAAAATTTPSCIGRAFTGAAFSNKFGVVQVAVVVSADKTLCDVQVLSYPDRDRKSVSINQRALPTLRVEALAAHSATIAGVSGATYTSKGYEASLQSALDAAK